MGISKYPHYGAKLAPLTLKSLLDYKVPKQFLKKLPDAQRLYELDKKVWEYLSEEECSELATIIEYKIIKNQFMIRSGEYNPTMPICLDNIQLKDLDLEYRTYHQLETHGYTVCTQLNGLTIKDFLAIPKIGILSLLDYLCSLETILSKKETSTVRGEKDDYRSNEIATSRAVIVEISEYPRQHEVVISNTMEKLLQYIYIKDNKLGGIDLEILRKTRWSGYELNKKNLLKHMLKLFQNNIKLLDMTYRPLSNIKENNFILKIDTRTYNCLVKSEIIKGNVLNDFTVGQLLSISGFGIMCLLDLLTAIDNRSCVENKKENVKYNNLCPLYNEIDNIISSISTCSRSTKMLKMRYGLFDGHALTLDEIGSMAFISKERTRQILSGCIKQIRAVAPIVPMLNKALEEIKSKLPTNITNMNHLLERQSDDIKSLLNVICNASELFYRKTPFIIKKIGEIEVVLPYDSADNNITLIDNISKIVRKNVGHWGASTVNDVFEQYKELYSKDISEVQFQEIVRQIKNFQWIDESTGWFWLKRMKKNPLFTIIKKTLSVSNKIHVSELRSAISRNYELKGFSPPRKILIEICKQSFECSINNEFIIPPQHFHEIWEHILKDTERTFVEVFKKYGPFIRKSDLEGYCIKHGMNSHTFTRFLCYSPIIARHGYTLYSLVGTPYSSNSMFDVAGRRRKNDVIVENGWKEGDIWIGFRLSQSLIQKGQFNIPKGLQGHIDGEYTLMTEDCTSIGYLKVGDKFGYGLNTLFRRRGGEPGDNLVLIFEKENKVTKAYIGDSNLFYDLNLLDK